MSRAGEFLSQMGESDFDAGDFDVLKDRLKIQDDRYLQGWNEIANTILDWNEGQPPSGSKWYTPQTWAEEMKAEAQKRLDSGSDDDGYLDGIITACAHYLDTGEIREVDELG